MDSTTAQFHTIDQYIDTFPLEIQSILRVLRQTIQKEAPNAEETIKYRMPTFTLHGNLVHFAAFKHHIGFFPAPSGIDAFASELARYRTGKGTLQFPLNQPLPLDLVRKIVRFRVQENLQRSKK